MRQTQVCAHGHRWDPSTDSRLDVQARWQVCPVCGGSVDVQSLHDTNTEGPHTPTREHLEDAPATPADPAIPGYQVLSVLGYGGVAVVYKARQVQPDRLVALKMLFAGAQARPDDLVRFRREMESAAHLDHPHIVRLFEVGEHNGLLYAALEYMDRGTLADAIAGNPMPPRQAAELVEILARAVQTAHDQGIVHRDLKPANVLLTSSNGEHPTSLATQNLLGVPKVADFGLARRLDQENRQTRTGAVLGTPSYMAPEQAEGKTRTVGPAADIYALGAILYECLTGKPPFAGTTMLETLDLVRSREPEPPSAVQPGVPRELETICLKCLAKLPGDRYPSAQGLAEDLRRFLAGQSIVARPTPRWRKAARWLVRRSAGVAAACLALLLALAIAQPWLARPAVDPAPERAMVAYYGNLTKRWGVPVGIGPLTQEQARHRHLSYRFLLRNGRVEKVEAVDRHGRLTPRHPIVTYLEPGGRQRSPSLPLPTLAFIRPGMSGTAGVPASVPCSWEYHRDDKGNLAREVARDVAGREVWTFQLTRTTADESSDVSNRLPLRTTGYYTDARGFVRTRAGSGASSVEMIFAEDGLVRELHFRGQTGRPRPDDAGTFGRRYAHDHRGLVTTVTFLGPRDQPVPHPLGYARITRTWDTRGLMVRQSFFDLANKPARSRLGGHAEEWTYDTHGNPTELRVIDLDEKLVRGSARLRYDGRGNLTAYESLVPDPPGPTATPPRIVYEHDGQDHCIRIAYHDAEGRPTDQTPARCAALALAHDEEGKVTRVTFLGLDGQPVEGNHGTAQQGRGKEVRVEVTYNRRGQLLSEELFGKDGKPVADRLGVARYSYAYDEMGRRTEMAFFGPDGKPTTGREQPGLAFARQTRKYDEQGNLIEVACYGLDGKLVVPPTGGAKPAVSPLVALVFRWLQVPGAFFSLVGRTTFDYDDRGNLAGVALFAPNGKPLPDAAGVARVKCNYDEQGNLIEVASFDAEGRPTAYAAGRARMTWSYDEHGNLTEVATYGPSGALVPGSDGIARHTRQYDNRYNVIAEAFIGADGKPTMGRFGYVRAEYQFDDEGNLIDSTYFGPSGAAVKTRVVWLVEGDRPGLRPGDVLLSYDGQPVRCARLFEQMKAREAQGGPPRELRLLREQEPVTVLLRTGPLRGDELVTGWRRWRWLRQQASVPGLAEPRRFFETRAETHLPSKREAEKR